MKIPGFPPVPDGNNSQRRIPKGKSQNSQGKGTERGQKGKIRGLFGFGSSSQNSSREFRRQFREFRVLFPGHPRGKRRIPRGFPRILGKTGIATPKVRRIPKKKPRNSRFSEVLPESEVLPLGGAGAGNSQAGISSQWIFREYRGLSPRRSRFRRNPGASSRPSEFSREFFQQDDGLGQIQGILGIFLGKKRGFGMNPAGNGELQAGIPGK